MSQAQRLGENKIDELPPDLQQLVLAIESLPGEHRVGLTELVERVVASTRRRRKILTLVQDALSQLRLDMKYLMFDLEATRRERDDYRTRLDGEFDPEEEAEDS
jgi:hypothetical protein